MGAGKYTTKELINAMVQMKDQVRIYIVCNAYEMNNEKNSDKSKLAWYVGVGYDLIDGKLDLTNEEEDEFINIHFKYLKLLQMKYPTFKDLPIHNLLDRFDLLKELKLN